MCGGVGFGSGGRFGAGRVWGKWSLLDWTRALKRKKKKKKKEKKEKKEKNAVGRSYRQVAARATGGRETWRLLTIRLPH